MKNKHVIILVGSPRLNGNCWTLARKASEGIIAEGGTVEALDLHRMNIKPCSACEFCHNTQKRPPYCSIQDDMQTIYPKLLAADAFIIASPVYWFTVSAQIKLVMDRWYALGGPDGYALKGKPAGIILTYGDSDPFNSGAVNALRTFQDAFQYIGVPIVGMVYGSAYLAGEIENNPKIIAHAFKLGQQVLHYPDPVPDK